MGQISPILTNDMIMKYVSVICACVSGFILLGYFIYFLASGSDNDDDYSDSRSGSDSFLGYRSLDTLYDDAGGNDPLSNARLTSDINISSDKYSCKYQVIYQGNNKRTVNCVSGCDGDDKESNFCKQYIYRDGDDLDNPLLDETYINRKEYTGDDEEE